MYEKFYVHEKIIRTQTCRRRVINNLLPEKFKENMKTKQLRFKSQLEKKNCYKSKRKRVNSFDIYIVEFAFLL